MTFKNTSKSVDKYILFNALCLIFGFCIFHKAR